MYFWNAGHPASHFLTAHAQQASRCSVSSNWEPFRDAPAFNFLITQFSKLCVAPYRQIGNLPVSPRSISLLLKSANFVSPHIGKLGALPVSPRSISLLLNSANFALPHIGKLGALPVSQAYSLTCLKSQVSKFNIRSANSFPFSMSPVKQMVLWAGPSV